MLVVIPYDDDDDAVRIANDCDVRPVRRRRTSGSLERALAVAAPHPHRHASASTAAPGTAPTSPFGGYKQSGIGRENGIAGFEQYLETKTIGWPAWADRACNALHVRLPRDQRHRPRHARRRTDRRASPRPAEAAGCDGFAFTDHPAPGTRWLDAGGHQTLDPFVALGPRPPRSRAASSC